MTEESDQIMIAKAEDVGRIKDELRTDEPKRWRHHVASTPALAVEFANRDPAQQAGEAVFSHRGEFVDFFLFW